MRRWMPVLVLLVTACSGQLSPGPVGQPLDLKQYLPDTLRAESAAIPDSTFSQEFTVGPDSARVELHWATFRHTTGRYVSSISGQLKSPVNYDSFRLANVSSLKAVGTKSEPVEAGTIQVLWFKHKLSLHSSGAINFGFDAAGSRTIGPVVR